MSIEDVNKIDMVSITKETVSSQQVILVITDHLDWVSDINNHLFKLQEKINSYISFIENGELYENFPEANGKDIVIKIFFQNKISPECVDFLSKVSSMLLSINVYLEYEEVH